MTYVISDIHGLYDRFTKMLEKINFSDNDTLYVLGDIIDRGTGGIRLLQYMMRQPNIIPIMGNHEYTALNVFMTIRGYTAEAYVMSVDRHYAPVLWHWFEAYGAEPTLDAYEALTAEEQGQIIKYISKMPPYAKITIHNKTYILVHTGLPPGAKTDNLGLFPPDAFMTVEADYRKKYFRSAYLVTGHVPTLHIDRSFRGKIYKKRNHIAIDTGAVFGQRMGCICLDTHEEFYV